MTEYDIEPLHNYIVFRRTAKETTRIILADSVQSEDMFECFAVAVGPEAPETIKVGDRLMVGSIKTCKPGPREEHWLIRATEVMAVLR